MAERFVKLASFLWYCSVLTFPDNDEYFADTSNFETRRFWQFCPIVLPACDRISQPNSTVTVVAGWLHTRAFRKWLNKVQRTCALRCAIGTRDRWILSPYSHHRLYQSWFRRCLMHRDNSSNFAGHGTFFPALWRLSRSYLQYQVWWLSCSHNTWSLRTIFNKSRWSGGGVKCLLRSRFLFHFEQRFSSLSLLTTGCRPNWFGW